MPRGRVMGRSPEVLTLDLVGGLGQHGDVTSAAPRVEARLGERK